MTLATTLRPIHLLLVDDNPADARLLLEALKEIGAGVRLLVAEGSEAAMSAVRGSGPGSPRPDLVLLDLNLGRDSGWDVLEQMKSDPELKTIPVVVLTSSRNPSDVGRAYQMYANCCLEKPAELDPYIEAVRSLLEFWGSVARLPQPKGRGLSGQWGR